MYLQGSGWSQGRRPRSLRGGGNPRVDHGCEVFPGGCLRLGLHDLALLRLALRLLHDLPCLLHFQFRSRWWQSIPVVTVSVIALHGPKLEPSVLLLLLERGHGSDVFSPLALHFCQVRVAVLLLTEAASVGFFMRKGAGSPARAPSLEEELAHDGTLAGALAAALPPVSTALGGALRRLIAPHACIRSTAIYVAGTAPPLLLVAALRIRRIACETCPSASVARPEGAIEGAIASVRIHRGQDTTWPEA
mmetsp:Transcript_60113/g.130375  ORF Transcript_60113/g.130375 Transcript_60113/m.130375 type:complete len:248 (+) Transcript_60113:107-850(+)